LRDARLDTLKRIPQWLPILGLFAFAGLINHQSTSGLGFAVVVGFTLAGLLTAVIIAGITTAPESLGARFLSTKPLRYIGRISYGIYLWDAVINSIVEPRISSLPELLRFGIIFGLTVLVASISYAYVETPFLRMKLRYAFHNAGVAVT
jgi:peptidoglycan/LPS O-acetylase OafA/YrhL